MLTRRFVVMMFGLLTMLAAVSLAGSAQAEETRPNRAAVPRAIDIHVAASIYHTCGIRVDDTVGCWGDNFYGQSTPPEDLGEVLSVSVGEHFTCAVKTDNTVRCWGNNGDGQSTPPGDLGEVLSINTKYAHTCAVKMDQTVRCWGYNNFGQATVPGDLGTVLSVSAGYIHTCAVKTDNMVRCWGENTYGQSTPPGDLGTVKSISAGSLHTCAVKSNNTVRCWGRSSEGQTIVPADLGTVLSLSTGYHHNCAVKTDNTLECWGYGDFGQAIVPVDLGAVLSVSSGYHHTCAVKTDNTVRCWGLNDFGQTTVPVPTVSLGLTGGPLAEAGGTATVLVQLSEYPWTNATALLYFSGDAARNVDYYIPASGSSFTLTPYDNTLLIPLIGLNDFLNEGDETIKVDIGGVTGAVENGIQQVTAIIQDDDMPTSTSTSTLTATVTETAMQTATMDITQTMTQTATETATQSAPATVTLTPTSTATESPIGDELVSNGGFEAALTHWSLKNGTSGKVKCDQPDKPVAYSGTCAFTFKGSLNEHSKLQQTFDLTGTSFAVNDTLNLSVYLNAAKATANGKVKVVIQYSDSTDSGKLSLPLIQTSGYEPFNTQYVLPSAAVSNIKIQITHTSSAGKLYIDDVSLIHNTASAPLSARLLPLP